MTCRFQTALVLTCVVANFAWAQNPAERLPRFEDYPAKVVFKGEPALPVLETLEERKFQAVIRDGVSKGWGVYNGASGKELRGPGPNFAGHYILVSFGCGEPFTECFSAAIVDARTGRVFRAPSPESGIKLPYFGVFAETLAPHPPFSFHNVQAGSPLEYRLNSRLLIAKICERIEVEGGSVPLFHPKGCGPHYYLIDEDGLNLIYRVVE